SAGRQGRHRPIQPNLRGAPAIHRAPVMASHTIQKRHAYLALGGAALLVSAGYLLAATDLPYGRLDQPGAGVFPVLAGGILADASLITMWEGWRMSAADTVELPYGADLKRLLSLVASLLALLIALPLLGYFISSLIFCAFMMRVLSDLTWARI